MAKEILIADNFGAINLLEETELSAGAAASQANVVVVNPQGYATNDYVLVGDVGSDRAEIKKILSITGQTITFSSNLSLDHTKDETLTKLRGNQINFYRAANVDGTVPSDASFSLVSTVSIEPDQTETEYVDSVGGSGYWYKFTYYNDVSSEETDISTAQAVRGGGYNQYASVDQVRTEAGLKNNKYIDDAQILEAIEDAEGQVKASLAAAGYTLPLAEVPYLIRYVTKQLAAGYLLTNSYGAQHMGTEKDGDLKIKRAMDILTKIESGKTTLTIPPTDETVSQDTTSIAGYPDDTASDNCEGPKFSMNQTW